MVSLKKSVLSDFVKYVISGSVVSVGEIGTLIFLVQIAGWHYLLASTVSFVAGLLASFVWRKFLVFASRTWQSFRRQLLIYSVVMSMTAILNLGLMYILVDGWHIFYAGAQIISGLILGLLSFTLNRLFTFKQTKAVVYLPFHLDRAANLKPADTRNDVKV